MTKLTTALAALALMITAAHSQTIVSGDYWITTCSKGAPLTDLVSCGSYVRGVADAVIMLQKVLPEQAKTCIPGSVSGNDLAALAFPYVLKQPPNTRQFMAAALLIGAFREAYPCAPK